VSVVGGASVFELTGFADGAVHYALATEVIGLGVVKAGGVVRDGYTCDVLALAPAASEFLEDGFTGYVDGLGGVHGLLVLYGFTWGEEFLANEEVIQPASGGIAFEDEDTGIGILEGRAVNDDGSGVRVLLGELNEGMECFVSFGW
jgi:hypothetical protein